MGYKTIVSLLKINASESPAIDSIPNKNSRRTE